MQFPAIESTKHYTTVTIPDRATVRDVFECAVFNYQNKWKGVKSR